MSLHPRQRLDLGHARAAELRGQAAASVVIRADGPEDRRAVARLAALDSAPVPPVPLLLAEVDGELRAALSLSSGVAIADPFHRTAWLVTLLTTRASQLEAQPSGRRRFFLARLRRLRARTPAAVVPRR